MNRLKNKCWIVFLCLLASTNIQNASAKWNFSMSGGYGVGQYEKTIIAPLGTYLYKDDEDYFLALFGKEKFKINYLSDMDISVSTEDITNIKDIEASNRVIFYNFLNKLTLTGTTHTLPISVSIYYEFYNKFRLGLGANISINFIKQLTIENSSFDEDLINRNKDLVRKIAKKQLNTENISRFKNNITYLPESSIKELEAVCKVLDPVGDKNEIEDLKTIISDFSNRKVDNSNSDALKEYVPRNKINFTVDPFILLGFKFIENINYSAIIDTQISPFVILCNSLTNFYAIKTYSFPYMIGAYSLGFTIEKHVSEYYRVFGRIAYKQYNYYDPAKDSLPIFNEKNWNISLQIGFNLDSPEIERCPVNRCKMQVKHRHEGRRFRGSSLFVGRNARGEKIFTK